MKTFSALAFLAGLAALALPTSVHAQIINVQIAPSANLYTGAGADPLAGDNWALVAPGTQSNVAISADSNNHPLSGVTVSTAADGFFSFYGVANGNNLIDGYDYAGVAGGSFSISGLAKSQAFTIYLYGTPSNQTDGGRETAFALSADNGGATATDNSRLAAEPSDTFLVNDDYVILTGTTTATGTISGTFAGVAGHGYEGDFNGFQLNAAVPEPSTWALMLSGLGLLALVPRLRRRA